MTDISLNEGILSAVKDVLVEAEQVSKIIDNYDDPRNSGKVFEREDLRRSVRNTYNAYNDLKGEIDHALTEAALKEDDYSLGFNWDDPDFSNAFYAYKTIRDTLEDQGFTLTTTFNKE